MTKTWNPVCVTSSEKGFGTSAKGFLTPCCWVDFSFYKDLDTLKRIDPKMAELFNDHLKIENNDCIEDIILSDEWIKFHNDLLSGPENAPDTCKKYCYKSDESKHTHKEIL
jgi:hypothetical protein